MINLKINHTIYFFIGLPFGLLAGRNFPKPLYAESGMVGMYRNLLLCDRLYWELISENREEIVEGMMNTEQKNFMKSMKKFPSVIRTQYAYYLLAQKDEVAARKEEKLFEKCAKNEIRKWNIK